jgi:hypothetical protein
MDGLKGFIRSRYKEKKEKRAASEHLKGIAACGSSQAGPREEVLSFPYEQSSRSYEEHEVIRKKLKTTTETYLEIDLPEYGERSPRYGDEGALSAAPNYQLKKVLKRGDISIQVHPEFESIESSNERSIPILRFLYRTLREWGESLPPIVERNPDDTYPDAVSFLQTQRELKPLLSQIRTDKVNSDIFESLLRISHLALDRRYVDCNTEYLKLAIGNKPWQVGVGNVFIQERSSLDRIATASHLLNEETTRRFVQSVKRLITKAEQFHPAYDFSQVFSGLHQNSA